MNSSRKRRIGFILFPELTQLDLTGPWEVFTRIPDTECCLLANTIAPVRSASGLCIVPGATYSDCGQMDIIVVPGGPGHFDAMLDDKLLSFLRAQEKGCERMVAVCTGTLVLAAAGLLMGHQCTTHWTACHRLQQFGATHLDKRVVFDRKRVTGGGVTAGIDLALVLATELAGEEIGRRIQLQMEYEPEPPFEGSPATAHRATVDALREPPADIAEQIRQIDRIAVAALTHHLAKVNAIG